MAMVRRTARGLFAIAAEDGEYFAPIPISDDDVRQFSVSTEHLVDLIRNQNGIDGGAGIATDGPMLVGQKRIDGYGIVEVYFLLTAGDPKALSAQCLSLAKPSGIEKLVVLTACAAPFTVDQRQLLDSRGIALIALSPLADEGSLAIGWEGLLSTRGDKGTAGAVTGPNTIVLQGRTYRLDNGKELTKQEMRFMAVALREETVPFGAIIHRGKDAVWKQTFNSADGHLRDRVSQMLSRLNKKLADMSPSFPFFFHLPRNRTSITRTVGPDS